LEKKMKFFITLALSFCLFSVSYAGQKIQVIDKDINNKGLECEIKIEKKDGTHELISYTDKNGFVQLEINCGPLEKVIFIPKGDYYSCEMRCPIKEKKIYLASIKYQNCLIQNANHFFEIGDYGTAAFAYSDIATRLIKDSKLESSKAEKKVYIAMGKYFKIDDPIVFDPTNQKMLLALICS